MERRDTRPVGGMAIVEGVMMRGPERWAAAVRAPGGEIVTTGGPVPTWSAPLARVPVLRGIATLVESLSLGVRVLFWSTEQARPSGPAVRRRPVRVAPTLLLGLAFAAVLFGILPAAVAQLTVGHGSLFSTVETVVRMAAFLGYLVAVSQLRDVRRIFAYHGAEHMAVAAHEAGGPMTVEAASGFGTRHVRCGTTFLFVVVLVSAIVTALIGDLPLGALAVSRVLVVPLAAGLAYEVLRLGAAGHWPATWIVRPGMALQALTTRRPDADQLEVALVALQEAIAPADTAEAVVDAELAAVI